MIINSRRYLVNPNLKQAVITVITFIFGPNFILIQIDKQIQIIFSTERTKKVVMKNMINEGQDVFI
ncbi:MAG: hypothetical protein CVU42_09010 [Chloroflexi bacterium HGW-Chloroflexi-4]|nr:MAG: hypothetical protein CVU42_09010 [Chloroflexi bacterium HGW-Chloroflexi-4]